MKKYCILCIAAIRPMIPTYCAQRICPFNFVASSVGVLGYSFGFCMYSLVCTQYKEFIGKGDIALLAITILCYASNIIKLSGFVFPYPMLFNIILIFSQCAIELWNLYDLKWPISTSQKIMEKPWHGLEHKCDNLSERIKSGNLTTEEASAEIARIEEEVARMEDPTYNKQIFVSSIVIANRWRPLFAFCITAHACINLIIIILYRVWGQYCAIIGILELLLFFLSGVSFGTCAVVKGINLWWD